ncbi:hypothetical protein VNI00_002197 [Paramarasmius palmivorus]|uniref:Uncharacterized protein n=1 Tax=Paramarasmius palmivorus TaxID=297713 RepID=A0AAW0E587_9AGAR
MSSHFSRLLYRTSRPCLRQAQGQCQRRTLAYSLPRFSELSPEPATAEEVAENQAADEAVQARIEAESEGGEDGTIVMPKSYARFMEEPFVQDLKYAGAQNWLKTPGRGSQRRPFPLNPTFLPPPPISDTQKQAMYDEYMQDPLKNSVRVLSQRYHISLKRVDAILRLKGMEAAWHKKKQVQTGFVRGMEKILGVPQFKPKKQIEEPDAEDPRYDAYAADSLEEIEQRDAARQRYQRMYWETLDEHGSAPVAPAAVEHAKKMAIRLAEKAVKEKNAKFLPPIADTEFIKWPKDPVIVATKPGRPDIHFIDVGAKYVDPNAELKRLASAGRRSRYRLKKSAEKKSALASA